MEMSEGMEMEVDEELDEPSFSSPKRLNLAPAPDEACKLVIRNLEFGVNDADIKVPFLPLRPSPFALRPSHRPLSSHFISHTRASFFRLPTFLLSALSSVASRGVEGTCRKLLSSFRGIDFRDYTKSTDDKIHRNAYDF